MIGPSDYLFALLCIPSRILIAAYARDRSRNGQGIPHILTILAFAFAIGFFRLWLNPSLRPTGPETFGKPIWWNSVRPIHSILWLAFAVAVLMDKPYAWKFLAVDVLVGLASYFFLKF